MHEEVIGAGGAVPLIVMATVTAAVAEARNNPTLFAVAHACLLDVAILVGMVKHGRAVSESAMRVRQIWDRLLDTVRVAENSPAARLRLPKYGVFLERLRELCEQGILHRQPCECWVNEDDHLLSINISGSEVISAIKDHPLAKFI